MDAVNPKHYNDHAIQPIDYMRAIMTHEQFEGYCLGNVIKYSSRYRLKNGLEDLQKCNVYLGWLREHKEAE